MIKSLKTRIPLKLRQNFDELILFLKDIDYPKMLLRTLAIVVPVLFFERLGNLGVGMSLSFGVLMSSPSDIPGSFRRRFYSILISIVIAVASTLIMGLTQPRPLIQVGVLCGLVFLYSLITVYGLRASLISFAGVFALVLSLSDLPFSHSYVTHALLIGCGGLWYLLLSTIYHLLTPKRDIDLHLDELIEETAEYLRIRGLMIDASPSRRLELQEELAQIHEELNQKHEKLREMLIFKRRAGKTTSGRRELLILIELVDILELGMANAVNYRRLDFLFKDHPEALLVLKDWSLAMARRLPKYPQARSQKEASDGEEIFKKYHKRAQDILTDLEKDLEHQEIEMLLVYKRLIHFKEKQSEKIAAIERLFASKSKGKRLVKFKGGERFLPSQEYSLAELRNQLDLSSPIFRHSLRLTLIILAGYFIGTWLEDPKVHWILLTSYVIMRPGYALTKERFKARLFGTLIGGGIAIFVLFTIDNSTIFGILAIVSLMFSYPVVQKNHKVGAAIITLNVVFLYGIISPVALEMMQLRVVDTAIGAGLAFLGNSFLWPSWQYRNLDFFIIQAIKANRKYLQKTLLLYQKGSEVLMDYKVARKKAFLATGDANAAFQRMSQEPKSKQKNYDFFYNVVSLNQELLLSIASIGSFVRTHPISNSSEKFAEQVEQVLENLREATKGLEAENFLEVVELYEEEDGSTTASDHGKAPSKEKSLSQPVKSPQQSISDMHLLMDQLSWTRQVSKRLRKEIVGS